MRLYHILFLALCQLALLNCSEPLEQAFYASDVEHFWEAYDQIIATEDTLKQKQLFEELYVQRGTPGLEAIMAVRNYTTEEYLNAIRSYPEFWQSVRAQTLRAPEYFSAIEENLGKLKDAYPELQLYPIYFSIGAFRTGGTTWEGKVLIGSELSLADGNVVIDELPDWRKPFYESSSPVDGLPLLCTHEYIHTQQKELRHELLYMCMYEGVAEFVSCQVTGLPSDSPAIAFGKANEERVVEKFVQDVFTGSNVYNWMWGTNGNELVERDLGYYVGYEICERYYQKAEDKQSAIRTLIELDFNNDEEIERIVDDSGLLPKTVAELRADYEQSRPTVVEIEQFENRSTGIDPGLQEITVRFSQTLSGYHAGIDYGSLGEGYLPKMDPQKRVWAADSTGYTIGVSLEPNRKYQFTISSNFQTLEGLRLKPFEIEFTTGE